MYVAKIIKINDWVCRSNGSVWFWLSDKTTRNFTI